MKSTKKPEIAKSGPTSSHDDTAIESGISSPSIDPDQADASRWWLNLRRKATVGALTVGIGGGGVMHVGHERIVNKVMRQAYNQDQHELEMQEAIADKITYTTRVGTRSSGEKLMEFHVYINDNHPEIKVSSFSIDEYGFIAACNHSKWGKQVHMDFGPAWGLLKKLAAEQLGEDKADTVRIVLHDEREKPEPEVLNVIYQKTARWPSLKQVLFNVTGAKTDKQRKINLHMEERFAHVPLVMHVGDRIDATVSSTLSALQPDLVNPQIFGVKDEPEKHFLKFSSNCGILFNPSCNTPSVKSKNNTQRVSGDITGVLDVATPESYDNMHYSGTEEALDIKTLLKEIRAAQTASPQR